MRKYRHPIVFKETRCYRTLRVIYRGGPRTLATLSKENWSRVAYTEDNELHILSYNEEGDEYILESIIPLNSTDEQRRDARATRGQLNAEGIDISSNEEVISALAKRLEYDPDRFHDCHVKFDAYIEEQKALREQEYDDPLEEEVFKYMHPQSSQMTDVQRKQVYEAMLPVLRDEHKLVDQPQEEVP